MCSIPALLVAGLSAFQGLAMQGAAKDKADQVITRNYKVHNQQKTTKDNNN